MEAREETVGGVAPDLFELLVGGVAALRHGTRTPPMVAVCR